MMKKISQWAPAVPDGQTPPNCDSIHAAQ